MDIRTVTPNFAASPQIDPADMEAIAAAGFTEIICNRPDEEVPAEIGSSAMRAAAEAAGLIFHVNPVTNGAMTAENIQQQGTIIDAASGPVLAYCRSGTRSTIVWALARAGRDDADDIVALAARAGYDIANMRGQLQQPYY